MEKIDAQKICHQNYHFGLPKRSSRKILSRNFEIKINKIIKFIKIKKLYFFSFNSPAIFSAIKNVSRDAEISVMSESKVDSLKSHINKLVSFGTRHTMSSTTDAKKELGC